MLCYELFSGTVVFGAFFMLTEPVTSPKRDFGKLMAGISSAIVVFLFRYFGGFEMGFASALIVMNVFSPIYDAICESVLHVSRHKESFVASIKEETKLRKNKKEEKKPVIRVIEKAEEPEELPEIKTEEISEEEILPEKEPGEIDLSENSEEKEEEALQL